MSYRNKTQKRVIALNRELPPRNEQFLIDFEQIQSQFSVSDGISTNFLVSYIVSFVLLCLIQLYL